MPGDLNEPLMVFMGDIYGPIFLIKKQGIY